MPESLPIVFLHYGRSNYLPFTIGQAKMMSLKSPVYLIGDALNAGYLPFVNHVNMNSYARQASQFEKIYKHLSPNGFGYELFCFLRWFILRDFMLTHKFEHIVHVDSDVLLYVDVNKERENWAHGELSLVNGVCAGNMFVNGTKGLVDLCTLIWDMYASAGSQEKLSAIYAERQKFQGAVSDMVALRAFYDSNPSRTSEMTGIQPDGSYWDANIHLDEGFEMHQGRKLIRWQNGKPFARHIESGRDIFFKSLHFQGIAKTFIEPAFRHGDPIARAAA